MEIHGLHGLVSFVGFWALFVLSGLLLCKLWLVPLEGFENRNLQLRWQQMLNESLVLLTFAGVALLLVRTAEMGEGSLDDFLSDVPRVLSKTHFGSIWSVHLALVALLWACSRRFSTNARSPKWASIAVLASALALAFTHSASSHASNDGDFSFAELNDWLHIVSTAVWGGAILTSALLLFPLLKSADSLILTVAERLSNLAAAALVVVLITGVCTALLRFPDWKSLTGTSYGRVLCVKLGVVAAMASIGAFNRFVAVPRWKQIGPERAASGEASMRVISRVLIVDAFLVVAALILAAALVQMDPPGGP